MVVASVNFYGPWDQVIKAFKSGVFLKNLAKEGTTAMKINLKIIEREVREAVRSARTKGPANAALTLGLKGGTMPLIDTSQMFKAIGSRFIRWDHGQVGVTRKEGGAVVRRAEIVHEGATINVTSKMFSMFLILHRLSLSYDSKADLVGIRSRRLRQIWRDFQMHSPGEIFPKLTRGVIVIPERPFLIWALQSDKMRTRVYHNFFAMVVRAIVRVPGIRASSMPKYRT